MEKGLYSLTEIPSVNEYKDATGRVWYLAALQHAAGAGSLMKSAGNFINEYKNNAPAGTAFREFAFVTL